jgi:hypothetical protein
MYSIRVFQRSTVKMMFFEEIVGMKRMGHSPRVLKGIWLGFVMSSSAIVLICGCSSSVMDADPVLPHRFIEVGLPDVEIGGYLYLAQKSPQRISLGVFGSENILPPEVPKIARVSWLAAFLGPTIEDFGSRVRFDRADVVQYVGSMLEESTNDRTMWHGVFDHEMRVVRGTGAWMQNARGALESGRLVSIKVQHPEAWEIMRLLPSESPVGLNPVAAGFLYNSGGLVKSLLDRQGVDGTGISSALSYARVKVMAFTVYTDQLLEISEDVVKDYRQSSDVGIVLVAKSGYPGFLVSFLFGNFMGQAGMENILIGEEKVYYLKLADDVHMFVKNLGSVLYFTVAWNRDKGEYLMESILSQKL